MTTYILYGTSGCHLCEVAHDMIEQAVRAGADCELQEVDIADSDALFERYGVLIPVLAGPQGEELRWPFSAEQLRQFLDT
ncbi:MAG: glutaredoxin family protein [Halioglobus sp.]|nr:glutaredoxin family protein [Halioglobus sp.]